MVPQELKGNVVALLHLLTHTLAFVFQNSDKKEIVLSLSAPKDFLYEELISFEIKDVNLNREKLTRFLETELSKDIELLNGEIIHKSENISDLHIAIPFKLNELGMRRYYRLPDKAMLDKKVLLICGSQKVARSIKKMFKYFRYDVVVGVDEYKRQGNNLAQYDILLIEDKLTTKKLENLIVNTQKTTSLKYVLLHDSHYKKIENTTITSSHLIKPVMQESIFELIVLLFGDKSIREREENTIIDMEKYLNKNYQEGYKNFVKSNLPIQEENKETKILVLDTEAGEQNAKSVGVVYSEKLKEFLDRFERSDEYFIQEVDEKSTWKIKEFCIDLEKEAKMISALRILKFAERISLLFVYNKLHTLPTHTNTYQIELKKLIIEIRNYLNKNYQEKDKNPVKSNFPVKEENKESKILVLDTEAGEQNAKSVGVEYYEKLKEFLDKFECSDEYFIQ